MGLFDPMDYLLRAVFTGGPRNGPGLDDKNLDQMLDDMKSTLDDADRVKKALDIQKYINEQVLSMAHLPQQHTYGIYNASCRIRPSSRASTGDRVVAGILEGKVTE